MFDTNDNSEITFTPTLIEIRDAVETWCAAKKRERLFFIYDGLCGREAGFRPDDQWVEFAKQVFDCSETSPEFVAAVLRKSSNISSCERRGVEATSTEFGRVDGRKPRSIPLR